MHTIPITTKRPYTVTIGSGLLEHCGSLSGQVIEPCKAVIVSDSTVAPLYTSVVQNSLELAGFKVAVFSFPAGEQSKTLDTYSEILECMAANELTRRDCVVALGGGVVGDLAGFAAGCFLRGIKYIQVPTTLLAAVDSSVGGKTAVNLAAGKNLAGLFWQPSAVICDSTCLQTLPDEVFLDGMAEVVKTAVLSGETLFARLEQHALYDDPEKLKRVEVIEDIIAECVTHKAQVVEADEHESSLRKSLNLGHTIGHAIEACSGYTLSHGHAVAAGLAMITRASVALGICEAQQGRRIVSLLSRLGLPVDTAYLTDELMSAVLHDKKRAGDHITLVFPERIGSCILRKVTLAELPKIVELGREVLS